MKSPRSLNELGNESKQSTTQHFGRQFSLERMWGRLAAGANLKSI